MICPVEITSHPLKTTLIVTSSRESLSKATVKRKCMNTKPLLIQCIRYKQGQADWQ